VAQDHNDIYSIVERLRILEEGLTPVTVKHGLNAQQKSVNQLGATFKPKTVAVLTAKQDPKNPLAGKLVGDSVENDKESVEEDVLDKVKKSFADYLSNVADEIKSDTDLKDKKKEDSDLKKKDKKDRDLVAKESTVGQQPQGQTNITPTVSSSSQDTQTGLDPEIVPELEEDINKLEVGDRVMITGPNHYEGEFAEVAEFSPSGKFVVVKFDNGDEASMHSSDVEFHDDQEDVEDWEDDVHADADEFGRPDSEFFKESQPVKTVTNECGLFEIHGNEPTGFEIRHGNRAMRSRFKTIDEAVMALEMFAARKKIQDESKDYIEEA
jgi:hypothetical protein